MSDRGQMDIKEMLKKDHLPFGFTPKDTFLASYPRAGNTWLRFLLAYYYNPLREWNIMSLNEIAPDMHQVEVRPSKFPRLIKTHLPRDEHFPKVIYIRRTIKDICISYYHAAKNIWAYTLGFEQFIEDFYAGRLWPGRYQDHVDSYQMHNTVLYVDYEQMKIHFEFIIEYLGWQWDSGRANKIFEICSRTKTREDHLKEFNGWTGQTPRKIKEVLSKRYDKIVK